MAGTGADFVAIVPVKPPAFGKSRLSDVPDEIRRRLAEAFALDTVTACLRSERIAHVLVATDDSSVASLVTHVGAHAIPDGTTTGLNDALTQAAAEARRRWPDPRPCALLADLPALTPTDLDTALDAAPNDHAAFVADADGEGTTLFTAPYDLFAPRFGSASRHAHGASGARPIEGALVTLRRDVDDLAALAVAHGLGLGVETVRVLADTGLEMPTGRPPGGGRPA